MTEVKRGGLAVHFVADTADVLSDNSTIALSPEEAQALDSPVAAPTAPGSAGLNPRYTFDTFIVGSSNQFAHAACRAVAESPSRSYNPLFIYGGVGLGKTHLMHAVGHYVLQHDRNVKLTYISSERFMNEMINAVRYDRSIDFRERYRSVDRAARRRHPVSRRQGRDAERVLPHVQRALRLAEADRAEQRLSAARNSRARGAAAVAIRVGPDRRHSVARPRDENRDSQEKGGSRSGAAARRCGDLHCGEDQVEHPRARRIADSPDRLRVADRPGDLTCRSPRRC